jgi:Prion-inhibition and propagation
MVFRVQKSCSLFRKVRWAVHDRSKFGTLLTQLSSFVDALYQLCPVGDREGMTYAVHAETLATTIIDRGPLGVQELQQAAHHSNNPALVTTNALWQATVSAARINAQNSVPGGQSFRPSQDIWVDYQYIQVQPNLPNDAPDRRSWAKLPPVDSRVGPSLHVLVEWRPYSHLILDGVRMYDVQSRIESLVRLLHPSSKPKTFRTLDCIGYVEDNSSARFGLVFQYPHKFDEHGSSAPVTLYQVLRPKGGSYSSVPYLGDRFALAAFLAESVFQFLAAGWLHKGINSHNLLFFYGPNQGATTTGPWTGDLEQPYFSGFALARPDGVSQDTSLVFVEPPFGLYRHPDVMGFDGNTPVRYNALYDIYSLGAVLLEIGTWTRLDSWYEPRMSGTAFRDRLLTSGLPKLGPSMGERYMMVVRKCLDGTFAGLTRFSGREADYSLNLQRSFYWEIVRVLKNFHV